MSSFDLLFLAIVILLAPHMGHKEASSFARWLVVAALIGLVIGGVMS